MWKRKLVYEAGIQPLVFDNLMTVADHEQHRWTVDYLRRKAPPSVVIAGSGVHGRPCGTT